MKTVNAPPESEPAVELECDCGHRFWVDPCGEENLDWSEKHKSLKAVCPSCGRREEDEIYGSLKKSDVAKSKVSGFVIGAGFVLAAPFLVVGALIAFPMILLSEKIHACKYEHRERYDAQTKEYYKLCTTCGDRIDCTDGEN